MKELEDLVLLLYTYVKKKCKADVYRYMNKFFFFMYIVLLNELVCVYWASGCSVPNVVNHLVFFLSFFFGLVVCCYFFTYTNSCSACFEVQYSNIWVSMPCSNVEHCVLLWMKLFYGLHSVTVMFTLGQSLVLVQL